MDVDWSPCVYDRPFLILQDPFMPGTKGLHVEVEIQKSELLLFVF